MNRFLRTLQRFHGRSAAEDGMSLIELMIAIFILAVAVLALAATAVSSLTTLRVSRERQAATAAAGSALENIRSYGFRDVAHVSSEQADLLADAEYVSECGTDLCFDHDGPGGDPPEELIFTSSGGVSDYRTDEDGGRLDVRRFVTWQSTAPPRRRATVVVSFSDSGEVVRTTTESTIIAEAERGLPVPQFEVAPQTIIESPNSDGLACFTHLLRNIGAPDRYDWRLHNATQDADGTFTLGGEAGVHSVTTLKAKGWLGEAWFDGGQYTGSSPDITHEDIWKDVTADQRPNSPVQVGSGESRTLVFCYRRNSGETEPSTQARRFGVVVRSAFDSSVQAVLFHRIAENDAVRTLYLKHRPPNDGSDPDVCGARTDRLLIGQQDYEPYDLNGVVPVQECDGSTEDNLYDYDRNVDPSGLPGLYQKRNTPSYAGQWDWRPGQNETVNTGQVTFFSATSDAFTANPSGTLTYTVRVQKVSGGIATDVATETVTYTHDQPGWMQVATSELDLGATLIEPGNGDVLRVRIDCESQNRDCHVGYDTNTHRSRLAVGLAP